MQQDHYFDYAAATPVDADVARAMLPFASENFANPSALYAAAHDARRALDRARATVAHQLGARSNEIVFTASCTEANNMAIHGLLARYPKGKVLYSAIEHDAVRKVAQTYNSEQIPVDRTGRVDIDALGKMLTDPSVILVSVMYVNNEIGTIQDLAAIARCIRAAKTEARSKRPLIFHSDAAQAGNYLPLSVHRLGVDMLSLNAAKLYGPKGVGCLYVNSALELAPQTLGGGQEFGLRSGTENVAGCVGLAVALEKAASLRSEESTRLTLLRDEMIGQLQSVGWAINGTGRHRIANNVSIYSPLIDNETAVMKLSAQGFSVATGSACHAASQELSPTLAAIGRHDEEIRGSLRITLGRFTTPAVARELVVALNRLLAS